MTTSDNVLQGCAPVPLAGYLKALGVFRLVSEQVDPEARGFWRDERFVLRTRLSEDELVRFFVEAYTPSPIISPWSGRGGFLEGDGGQPGQHSSRGGAKLVRGYESAGERFSSLRDATRAYRSAAIVKELDGLRSEHKALASAKKARRLDETGEARLKQVTAEEKRRKSSALAALRSEAPGRAIQWVDACWRVGGENVAVPLLGAGGNDGSRDFGMSFGAALGELFDFRTGRPKQEADALARLSLYGRATAGLKRGNLGQYQPGGGGENATSGFVGDLPSNPFDMVLLLEGALLFSGASARRLDNNADTRASLPFTVRALTAGSGAAAASADSASWAEFWAPLWTRPAPIEELKALLREGRSALGTSTVRDGLEFAVAARRLGSERGISEFQRYALLQREPRNPRKATPLGRVHVRENPRAPLVSELDQGGWLTQVRRSARDKRSPACLRALVRRLENALFALAAEDSRDAVQEALMAVGALTSEVGRRPRLHGDVSPPPLLSTGWAEAADDGSHEFALAAALVSLDATTEATLAAAAFTMPFRRHLAALAPGGRRGAWDDKTTEARTLAVWTGRDLRRDLAAVLERRLLEAQRRSFVSGPEPELPLRGRRTAPLSAVAAFLAGHTDDDRLAALAAGLGWARSGAIVSQFPTEREGVIPFAYAALEPLFDPRGVSLATGERRLLDPLPVVRLLRAGRLADAVALAQRLARGAGLPAPFAGPGAASIADPASLAAALLFPISSRAQARLIARAYPSLTRDEEDSHGA
jgi:CRISPR-associated protein Csx17